MISKLTSLALLLFLVAGLIAGHRRQEAAAAALCAEPDTEQRAARIREYFEAHPNITGTTCGKVSVR